MNRPRLIRGLRIAWSVGCGLPCIVVIMLWFRSYKWNDEIYVPLTRSYEIAAGSIMGHLIVKVRDSGRARLRTQVIVRTDPADSVWPEMVGMFPKFALRMERTDWALYTPHWLPAAILAAMFVPVWIGKRFSLRTLLIATTLVAVVLGLAVWSAG